MNEPKRPLPRADEFDTQAFWAGTKDKEFRYQQCKQCETVVFYARRHCTGCLDGELEWKVASGRATVYTYSIVRVEDPLTEVAIGMPLEIEWEEHDDLCIPLFKPA